ncbi:hypothetical protein QAD02_020783 [Eretmocerus hayati]|uniref:Uncharacterized protein n=1 Tax=Eretmocerus hayati TaxID=131215 RepID=A0ACC2PT63_9HYME|nr:hypothetical protein QAD02_020783 [Eretmocerus hayati]
MDFPQILPENIECRMDWHQTEDSVFVTIYAKQYDPQRSQIKLNPVRLTINLFLRVEALPFKLDVELNQIVDERHSTVDMFLTKVEIKLKKKEPVLWHNLENCKTSNDGVQGRS